MTSPLPLSLETERLWLRRFVPEDTSWHRGLTGERDAPELTAVEDAAVIARVIAQWSTAGFAPYVLVPKATGIPIGYCGLVIGRSTVDEPELAYELFRAHPGVGFATEAAKVVVAAARDAGRGRLWSTIGTWNSASINVIEKVGFARDRLDSDAKGEFYWYRLDL